MDNLNNNEDKVTVDTATADVNMATAELKKFKDIQTLIKAYTDLEAEFTRRSQRLKELEKENKALSTPDEAKSLPSPSEQELLNLAKSNGKVREEIISEYLKSIENKKSIPFLLGGISVTTPKNSPKSVKEAGKLALEFLGTTPKQ